MSNTNKITLLPSADKSLKIIEESDWSENDRKVWKAYEDIDDIVKYPYAEALGRYNEDVVIFGRVVTDSSESFEDYGISFGDDIDDTVIISTCVFKFDDPEDVPFISNLIIGYENVLTGDGSYNIVKDILPSDYVDLVIENSLHHYCEEEDDVVPVSELKINKLLSKNSITVDQVKDSEIKKFLIKILNSN